MMQTHTRCSQQAVCERLQTDDALLQLAVFTSSTTITIGAKSGPVTAVGYP